MISIHSKAGLPDQKAAEQRRRPALANLAPTLVRRLAFHSEEMALALVLWLCSLPLIALLVIPFFGPKVAGLVALLLLVGVMVVCWGLCGWRILREETDARHGS